MKVRKVRSARLADVEHVRSLTVRHQATVFDVNRVIVFVDVPSEEILAVEHRLEVSVLGVRNSRQKKKADDREDKKSHS